MSFFTQNATNNIHDQGLYMDGVVFLSKILYPKAVCYFSCINFTLRVLRWKTLAIGTKDVNVYANVRKTKPSERRLVKPRQE